VEKRHNNLPRKIEAMQSEFEHYGDCMSRPIFNGSMNKAGTPKAAAKLLSKSEEFKALLDHESDGCCTDQVVRARELIGRSGWPSAAVLRQVAQLLAASHQRSIQRLRSSL
jgi:hypothetical protein